MKVLELISQLQKLAAEHGDLDVNVFECKKHEDNAPLTGINGTAHGFYGEDDEECVLIYIDPNPDTVVLPARGTIAYDYFLKVKDRAAAASVIDPLTFLLETLSKLEGLQIDVFEYLNDYGPDTAGLMIYNQYLEQIDKHGFTSAHDDGHCFGELLWAALSVQLGDTQLWPEKMDKHLRDRIADKSNRDRMIISAALTLAEYHRMRRQLQTALAKEPVKHEV